jgi:hypothetical protein
MLNPLVAMLPEVTKIGRTDLSVIFCVVRRCYMTKLVKPRGHSLGMPPQYADRTVALHLGHFALKAVIGAHVTRLLVRTEADPGLHSPRLMLSEEGRGVICQFSISCPEPTPHALTPGVITWAHGMELEPPEPPRAAVMAPGNYLAPPTRPSSGGGPPSGGGISYQVNALRLLRQSR